MSAALIGGLAGCAGILTLILGAIELQRVRRGPRLPGENQWRLIPYPPTATKDGDA
jgi:hypothetical protein